MYDLYNETESTLTSAENSFRAELNSVCIIDHYFAVYDCEAALKQY